MVIESSLRRKIDDVVSFVQILQNSTRFLHNLCCHSKVMQSKLNRMDKTVQHLNKTNGQIVNIFPFQNIKDTTIIALIPTLRETVSQLVYKMKAALAGNNCSSGFWAGNLKNKDMNGEDILSQVNIS